MAEGDGVFNVNEYVWTRLTELGWKVFDDHHRALGLDPAPYRSRVGPPDGWQRFQLWELMQIFGPEIRLGMRGTLFDNNNVRFNEPSEVASRSGK